MDASERRTRANADATEWWLKLQSGEMSRGEREQYVIWLRESPVHVAEMLHVARIHGALGKFDGWNRIGTEGAVEDGVLEFPNSMERAAPPESKRKRVFAALAASVLVAAALAFFLVGRNGQTIETERGERREVALSDGSVLQVDPQTQLRVKFDERTRSIVLEHGRALFRVARDSNRPFLVQAEDTLVRAVGTAFAVDHLTNDVTVTVTEGKVSVARNSAADVLRQPQEIPGSDVFLGANEQLIVKQTGASAPRKVDTGRELAWVQGRLIFDNATVADAVADFNRYNRIQLRVADRDLAARTINGVFDASDPESFTAFIQTVTGATLVRDDGTK